MAAEGTGPGVKRRDTLRLLFQAWSCGSRSGVSPTVSNVLRMAAEVRPSPQPAQRGLEMGAKPKYAGYISVILWVLAQVNGLGVLLPLPTTCQRSQTTGGGGCLKKLGHTARCNVQPGVGQKVWYGRPETLSKDQKNREK